MNVFHTRCAHRILGPLENCEQCIASARERALMKSGPETSLSVGIKPGDTVVSLWALVPKEAGNEEPHQFWCVGTGWEIPWDTSLEHIGTAIEPESATVWHVFMRRR